MSEELKNKDGIQLRVGQVWESMTESKGEILAFRGGRVVCWNDGWYSGNASPDNDTYFRRLISDPIWGDMSEHVIVTDKQKGKFKIPKCAEFYAQDEWNNGYGLCWSIDLWRVPSDFDDWEPIEPIETEKPKYKLFKIYWSYGGPMVKFEGSLIHATDCPLVDGYRVGWGFTDNELWKIGDDGYSYYPCHISGNCKYTIGRLETTADGQ